MSEKLLKWLIYITGVVCLYAFLAIRIFPMFNFVLAEKVIPEYWENTKYGELYYFNHIRNFREKNLPKYSVKYRFTKRHPKLKDADILTFGDSFFDFTRMVTFPEQLSDTTHKKVFYARYDMPLKMLNDSNYSNNEPKILIYETAERFLNDRFLEPCDTVFRVYASHPVKKAGHAVIDFLFPEEVELKYTTLLSRSYFTTCIYSSINTFKFDSYGYITSMTPAYSLDYEIPWLFGFRQMDTTPHSFYYKFSNEEINNYCDNIAFMAKELKEKYNLCMVFMIIPSKYTVYHNLLNNDAYNNFIPRMYAGLEKRNIPVVKFYKEFMESNELLYYGTDTHWTDKGLKIALNKTIDVYDSLYTAKNSCVTEHNNQKSKPY